MPMGKGTYGSKVGRPKKKKDEKKNKRGSGAKQLPAALKKIIEKKKGKK